MQGAAIKRLYRGERKRQKALCTIPTPWLGESKNCVAAALDAPNAARPRVCAQKFLETAEPFAARAHSISGGWSLRPTEKPLDQDEIEQREGGGEGCGSDQRVVGGDVRTRRQRGRQGFLSHLVDLDQGSRVIYEVDHILDDFIQVILQVILFGTS
jgi:hypothetical protein